VTAGQQEIAVFGSEAERHVVQGLGAIDDDQPRSISFSQGTDYFTDWQLDAMVRNRTEKQPVAGVVSIVSDEPGHEFFLRHPIAKEGLSNWGYRDDPACSPAFPGQGPHVGRPFQVRDQGILALKAQEPSGEADQLGRTVGHQHLSLARQGQDGLEIVLEGRNSTPEGQTGVTPSDWGWQTSVAPAEEMLEVQGTTFFAGQPSEVTIGRLSRPAHAAEPGGIQVECTIHVYT